MKLDHTCVSCHNLGPRFILAVIAAISVFWDLQVCVVVDIQHLKFALFPILIFKPKGFELHIPWGLNLHKNIPLGLKFAQKYS
jgi:hypothetical protein